MLTWFIRRALRQRVPGATIARILHRKEDDMIEPTREGVRFAGAELERRFTWYACQRGGVAS